MIKGQRVGIAYIQKVNPLTNKVVQTRGITVYGRSDEELDVEEVFDKLRHFCDGLILKKRGAT